MKLWEPLKYKGEVINLIQTTHLRCFQHAWNNQDFLFRGNLDKAIEMFNKAINLAKSEMEMAHLYSLCDAAYAQTEVARKYGLKPPTL